MTEQSTLSDALADRYTIERELGRGGMATVYLARDLKHDRLVALKVLNPELGAVLGAERFLTEIRVTAALQHPHLLPLFDSGEANGLLFYVMPFVEGESLRALLEREKQLSIDEALRITTTVLSALEYAHERGIIHRDLKPENILIQHGEPMIADFGIALAVSRAGGQRVTQTGLSLGTPQYMSPEQATGDRNIDARSDIYSVGAMAYEMLAGEPPHAGGTVQAVIAKVITERPRSLRLARDTVPESVDTSITKALAKLPADRWSSARAFADSLKGVQATTIRTGGVFGTLATRTHRTVRSIAAWRAATAVLLLCAAALAWRAFRPRPESGELQLARQLTFEGNVVGAAISPDGAWLAYVTDDCFDKDYSCSNTLEVREVDGTQSVKLLTLPFIGNAVRWSPDGSTVGFVAARDSSAPSLFVIPRLGGAPQRVAAAPDAWTFAPDGRLVIVGGPPRRQSLFWLNAHTFARNDSAVLPRGLTPNQLDIAPDGAHIATLTGAPTYLLTLLDGRGRLLDTLAGAILRSVRWDASGGSLLGPAAEPGIADNLLRIPVRRGKLRVADSSTVLGQITDGSEGFIDEARSGRLVVVSGPETYELLTLALNAPGKTWTPLAHQTSWEFGQDVSPDGTTIAGSATDNLGDNAYVFPLDGGAPRAVSAQRGLRDYPRWSADGKHLAYEVGTHATVFTDAAGGPERVIHQGSDIEPLGWAGGDAVAFVSTGLLTVLDTTGRLRRRIIIPDSLAYADGVVDAARARLAYWSPAGGAIVVADLATGSVTPVLRTREPALVAGWDGDGSIYVATAAQGAANAPNAGARRDHLLQKLAPGGTALLRVATIPSACWVSNRGLNVGGPKGHTIAVCTVRHYAPDVWLADRAGRSGW